MGIAAFAYIHFDAMDGKQARRTGTSSPLGQLVDHGCDCINLTFMVFMFWSVYGLEVSVFLPVYASMCFAVFIASTWEEFHTGVLYLGPVNGPIEGTTMLSACSILTGVMGRQIWDTVVFREYRLKDCLVAFIATTSLITIVSSIVTVLRKKGLRPMHDLLPSFAALYCGCWWLFQQQDMWAHRTITKFIGLMGLMTSNLVSRIVVNHVMHEPYPRWTAAFLPVILGCFLTALRQYSPVLLRGIDNYTLVLAGYAWVILMQLHYHYVIFNAVSLYLGINVFSIPYKKSSAATHPSTPRKSQPSTPKKTKTPLKESQAATPTKKTKTPLKESNAAAEKTPKATPKAKRNLISSPSIRQSPRLIRTSKP